MNSTQQALYDRLVQFQIDEPGTELTFARRLARENGWTLNYAERVIDEYKRFLFLACAAGHVVSPSEPVDQAWHLHLTYTRSYWDDLCGKVLGKPLHHLATKGGASEQAKYIDLYNQTLASYQHHFGVPPPADIWPPAKQRFGEDLHHVTVNTQRHWIVPKPRWPNLQSWLPGHTPLFALGLVSLPLAAVTWNPLDLRGPEFLGFYFLFAVTAFMIALIVRLVFKPAEPESFEKEPPLDAYETACLAGGPHRAVQAAFAALVHDATLKIVEHKSKMLGIFNRTTSTIEQGGDPPPNAPKLERVLFDAARPPAANIDPLVKAGLPVAQDLQQSLIKRELMRSAVPTSECVAAGLIMASPLLVGIPKIFVGLSRGRPVEFLIIACVMTAIAALIFTFARSRHTARGKAAVETLQNQHEKIKSIAREAPAALRPADLALAVGLFGVAMLATGPLEKVHAMLPRAGRGGESSVGGCGSGCGCGGGCGGGGCGGGGCGGCGG